ncbi:hypothetical protein GCM10009743_61620 [Kribbella swartbergensis]
MLEAMTGDFLPRRRKASLRAQLLTVLSLLTAAALGIYLYT